MGCPIETLCGPGGEWIASVPALPGLKAFALSQEEALSTARKLSAILLPQDAPQPPVNLRILAFYPGSLPSAARGNR
jgi:predicted RNase H-like HicB family nuclease